MNRPKTTEREIAILKVAENMVREGGYNAFSFRDIAAAVGIKSSSVHYHFPTKEDLGAAVARYYSDRFIEALGPVSELVASGVNPITTYITAFRNALTQDKRMCLCGLLGAEADGLPKAVVAETKAFFERNLKWLSDAFLSQNLAEDDAHSRAIQTLSLLEGAMIASNVMNDIELFDRAAALLNEHQHSI